MATRRKRKPAKKTAKTATRSKLRAAAKKAPRAANGRFKRKR